MQKKDGIYNRNSFPECNPEFWKELIVFAEALEERLFVGKLQHETGTDNIEDDNIGMSKEEIDIIDKLIFWRLCSSLKNRYAVVELLLNKKLHNSSLSAEENIHILEELYYGRLFPEERMLISRESENTYRKILQDERKFADKLDAVRKEKFDKIIYERVTLTAQQDKECFIYGFQCALKMFMSVFTEYNKDS